MTLTLLAMAWSFFALEPAERVRPPVVIADFDGKDFGAWEALGTAFEAGPAPGTLPGQQVVSGFRGKGLVNSFQGGDRSTGTLTSTPFRISRRFLNLLVGGGEHPDATKVELLVDGKVVRTETGTASTGADDEHLSQRTWDVGSLEGKEARIVITDRHNGGWGHILVDEIVLSDERAAKEYGDGPLGRAMASVQGAAPRAAADPLRPAYHLAPPALWCNDPNGPIYHDGWYHVFYQHNPYGDRWEHMHWGHARSRDMVHWEHLPIALGPSKDKGEDHCFSGSAAVNAEGKVMLFYTSIGPRLPEQWAAVAEDTELMRWTKLDKNPILTEAIHGKTKIEDWRDPFVFDVDGKKWMVIGGHPKGQKGGICLYEAMSGNLQEWAYRGVAFQGEENNWECPNLFMVDQSALLLYSPHDRVKYYTGAFDTERVKFRPKHHGHVDYGGDFYATSAFRAANGEWVVLGWIRGFPGGRGWNGCLSLPRIVHVTDEGVLQQSPLPELVSLREGEIASLSDVELSGKQVLEDVHADLLEIDLSVTLGSARRCGLKLRQSDDHQGGATLFVDEKGFEVAGERGAIRGHGTGRTVELKIFLDRSVLEVFVNGEACLTKVIQAKPGNLAAELFADGGTARIESLRVWKLKVTIDPGEAHSQQ